MNQALHKLSVKTVTWAAQEEEELANAPQESAQPLAGEELVAGVDYNDSSHDVEVGSDTSATGEEMLMVLRLRTLHACARFGPCV